MVATVGDNSVQLAESVASSIASTIYSKRHEMWVYGSEASVQTILTTSNAEFDAILDREAYIDTIDQEWSSTPADETTPLMDQIMENNISIGISDLLMQHYVQEHGVSVYSSVAVTNKYGVVVGMKPRVAEYRHDNAPWWPEIIENGSYFGDVEFDPWLDVHGIGIATTLRSPEGVFSGAIIGFVDLVSVVEEAVYLGRPHETTTLRIIRDDGRMIFSDKVFHMFEDVSDEKYFEEISEPCGYFILNDDGIEKLFSYSLSLGFLAYPGNDWIILVDHQTAEVLSSVDNLRASILAVAIPLLGLSVLSSYVFARSISRRVRNVSEIAREFSTGKLDVRIGFKGSDEIDQLGKSFNVMADDLSVLYSDLEGKVAERTKEVEQANRKLRLLGSITRHDALNQVSIIAGWVSLAEETAEDKKLLETLRKIKEAAVNLETNLEFTSLYEKVGIKKPEWVQMDRALTHSLFGMGPREFEMINGFGDLQVYCDPMIQNVLRNLVDNSIRHGGKIKRISFTYREGPEGLTIVCEDDGVGVPPEKKEGLFEPSRTASGRKSFGLYLSKEILSITGITIRETGEPGKGARFEMHVPKGGYRFQRSEEV
ncbi:MAG: sensor histidine kinase [Methanobacteriota archaeon]|nr:MAG: sensor histidine kinase [Euryarchaeota archaeon]